MNKHEASGFYSTPCELAWKVFNVAARLSVQGQEHLSAQAELGIRLQPAVLLLAARMSGALYSAARQRVEVRLIYINQAGSAPNRTDLVSVTPSLALRTLAGIPALVSRALRN